MFEDMPLTEMCWIAANAQCAVEKLQGCLNFPCSQCRTIPLVQSTIGTNRVPWKARNGNP